MKWSRPRLLRRLGRFARIPARRKLLVGEAALWLALSRLALLFVPFQHLAVRFGKVTPPGVAAGHRDPSLEQRLVAQDIGWAVTRSAKYLPFRAVCLPQAIAAKAMLSRRRVPSVMHFGVAKKPGEPLAAHAWLDVGPIEVTGYPVAGEFTEVARFL